MLDSARRLGLAAMLFAAGGGTGCATWVNGRTQEVRVVTDPPGAAVTLNGQPVGLTPATLVVPRRGRAELAFAKEGHESATLAIPREGSWWLWGNAWVWNPLAAQGMPSTSAWLASVSGWFAALMAVDLLSGGAFVRPRVLAISLVPVRDFTGPLAPSSRALWPAAPAVACSSRSTSPPRAPTTWARGSTAVSRRR